ncbi:MAG: helix-turn-helix domain-containing protein [Deltaproteobacteria bacterium]|nr:helix-turn-helix domain-containing protein [Deltaproteobacteria bacterium]
MDVVELVAILTRPREGSHSWSPFDGRARTAFVELLRRGVRSRRDACARLGLSRTTVNDWLRRGKAALAANEEADAARFVVEVEAAEAERDSRPYEVLYQAARMDWHAALALVRVNERRLDRQAERRLAMLKDNAVRDALRERLDAGKVLADAWKTSEAGGTSKDEAGSLPQADSSRRQAWRDLASGFADLPFDPEAAAEARRQIAAEVEEARITGDGK